MHREGHRIKSFGGKVEAYKDVNGDPLGPLRIWVPDIEPAVPGLAMTRSIGDKVASQIGLIYKPEILEHRLTYNDKFIILATDGLWEFISSKKAVEIVGKHWQLGKIADACEELVTRATKKWKAEDDIVDDITVMIVYLKIDF